jgi:hypothetical protein
MIVTVLNTNFQFSDSLYVINRNADEGGESESIEINPDEVIVWNRPDDFMGGKSRTIQLRSLTAT